MSFVSYQQVTVSTAVLTVSDLTVPAAAYGASLQADTQDIRYTMDGTTAPTAGATGVGMVLLTTSDPQYFRIEDILNIKFIRGAGSDAKLNVHWVGGSA